MLSRRSSRVRGRSAAVRRRPGSIESGLAGAVAVVEHERGQVEQASRPARTAFAGGLAMIGGVGRRAWRRSSPAARMRAALRPTRSGRRRVAALATALLISAGDGTGHVGVNAEQFRCGAGCPCRWVTAAPQSPPCATNRVVSEALHQRRPRPGRCVAGSQPVDRRLGGEPVARQRRESPDGTRPPALAPCAVGLVSGSMIFSLLDDRAGPAVGDDQRQRVLVLGADVDEVNVQPVDLGDEVAAGRSVAPRTCASRTPSAQ